MHSTGPESWNVVTHADFNGKVEDIFSGTSLHISFTEYNPSVIRSSQSARDNEVFILESVVSIHDHGRWVGDLDVLQALENCIGSELKSILLIMKASFYRKGSSRLWTRGRSVLTFQIREAS